MIYNGQGLFKNDHVTHIICSREISTEIVSHDQIARVEGSAIKFYYLYGIYTRLFTKHSSFTLKDPVFCKFSHLKNNLYPDNWSK